MGSGARPRKVWVCSLVALCSILLLPEAQALSASVQRAAKLVVAPLPLSSHVAIHDAIIVEMLARGHQVKVCIYTRRRVTEVAGRLAARRTKKCKSIACSHDKSDPQTESASTAVEDACACDSLYSPTSVQNCIREAVSFMCPTARLLRLQLIYPENGTPRLRDQLLSHSNLTVEHYEVPLDELAVRLSAKVANRQPGLEGAKASFGAQYHSKIILEDAALHKRIEVCLICLSLPRMHAASVVLWQALPLSVLPASIMYCNMLAH